MYTTNFLGRSPLLVSFIPQALQLFLKILGQFQLNFDILVAIAPCQRQKFLGELIPYYFIHSLVQPVRKWCGRKESHPIWTHKEATLEKWGQMAENECKLLGLYGELCLFLTGINLYNSKGLSASHDIHKFLTII